MKGNDRWNENSAIGVKAIEFRFGSITYRYKLTPLTFTIFEDCKKVAYIRTPYIKMFIHNTYASTSFPYWLFGTYSHVTVDYVSIKLLSYSFRPIRVSSYIQ